MKTIRTLLVAIGALFVGVALFAPATADAFCDPPNLLIVLDRSGSMITANKWTDAKSAINAVTVANQTKIRFGLETFSDSATVDAKLPSSAAAISTALGKLSPLGQTFMVKAMTTARSHITSVLTADPKKGRPTSILFITDGEPSDRCPTTEVSGMRNLTVGGLKYDVKTYVIGFGSLVNRNCLNDMATRGGTALSGSVKYYVANSANDLVAAMDKIVKDATRKQPEVCDNKDNDCDGSVDESLSRSCANNKCKGTEKCSKGKWAGCTAQASTPETCDNKDNDCDGAVDESLTRACTAACGTGTRAGTERCSKGKWIGCTAKPSAEKCDNIDNDCDGSVDEGISRACTDPQTRCRGTQVCKAGKYEACNAPKPVAETCDNKDNDCDGRIDESLTRACTATCGTGTRTGTETCSRGRWINCSAKPSGEKCDNIDNDCDGSVDEGITRGCTDPQTRCRGTQVCKAGKYEACNAPKPVAEKCDKVDNDCDGRIDESLTQACTYKCGTATLTGTERCSNGKWVSCTARPATEICDNKDNDCDGSVDESLSRSCGKCGTQTCAAGKWKTCVEAKSSPEICDNKDNDCDGTVDENLKRACTFAGKCSSQQTCTRGRWSTCPRPAELCNGKDDDCDGKIDENWPDKGRICGIGLGICYRTGKFSCKPDGSGLECNVKQGQPSPEVCDAKDNDCDGKNDEDLKRACKTKCLDGLEECKEGSWTNCVPNPGGKVPPEKCNNGIDDNCNGTVDEGCGCPPGATRACGNDKGECKAGVQKCVSGEWAKTCEGATTGSAEVCDGKDNNCDGQVDENVRRKCTTACGEGDQACIQGDWSTCSAGHPQTEICNGLDDDCDGAIDDGATGECGDNFACVEGGCRAACRNGECPGGQRCIDGYCVSSDCRGVSCPSGYQCEAGKCVDLCTKTQCPPGLLCRRGKCLPKDCYAYGCESGKYCVSGICVDNPCANKTCANTQFCRDGSCVESCNCKEDEQCVKDQCQEDPCTNKECAANTVCRDGKCEKTCPTRCHDGQFCEDGQCVHDPCHSITCPVGTKCYRGQCTNRIPPVDPPSDGAIDPDGSVTDAGVTDTSGSDTSGNDTKGGSDTAQGDTSPGSDKLDPKSKDALAGDGAGGPDGCGCHHGPLHGGELVWLLLILGAFVFAARRRS